MILPNDTTVLVANGEKLRLYRNKGLEPHIRLVELPEPKLDTHNRGSGGHHRSTTANPDEKRLAEDNFAIAVAEYVNGEVLAGHIAALYVIADPRSLGEMRPHFHASTRQALVGELAKDLTHHSAGELEAALTGH
ncbi:host attachment protein [Nitratireductor sp. ZSWI3]|uniref:baeRF12 domain-containing protein n=1 Tax=Nitratireductor sp. ZSWI3 TaxID=2966359 RepID=UPI00214FCAD6|nr:host attachment protein [Nitratireductor sp. ZSWI3]MCR4269006.1 host attachment protein [Nitratireductor sp. ZSWI3]